MIAKLILYKYSESAFSFKMRLTNRGRRGYESVNVPFTTKEWNYNPVKRKNELKNRMPSSKDYTTFLFNRDYVKTIEKKYQDEIDKLIRFGNSFSFSQVFKNISNPKKENPQTVYKVFDAFIQKEKNREAYSNAKNIHGTLNKLKSFHTGDMLFNEVDVTFLLQFRDSMEEDELSSNTISIHLRNIRTIYNYAIRRIKVASLAEYPFIDNDIMSGLRTAYTSRAISLDDVNNLRDFRLKQDEGSELWHACNYFIFGYAGRGINFVDLARLKMENYIGGRITFLRRKTKSKIKEEISFPITPELKEILNWYMENDRQIGNPYIFPILNTGHITEKSKNNRIVKVRAQLNSNLNIVGEKIGADIAITTYVWRHTFAALAKNDKKISQEMISEMLGHNNLQTTKHYLKNFPDSDLDEATAGM